MRKVPLSEAVPHLIVIATVVTILVVFFINLFPPLKEPEFIDESSESSSVSVVEGNISRSAPSAAPSASPSDSDHENPGEISKVTVPSSETPSGKININTATVSELMTLDGIGEVKAKAIVEYREKNGYFKSIDDITLVKGIGEKTLEKNRDKITV